MGRITVPGSGAVSTAVVGGMGLRGGMVKERRAKDEYDEMLL